MKPKTLFDVAVQEATDFIKLPFFLDALEHSPLTKQFVNYDAFFMLLDKGLPLRFSEPGCCFDDEKIPNGDVKCALLRVGDALFETDTPRMKLFTQEIIKTEAGNDIPLAGILIGREDVRRICAGMGLNEYPWVKIPWPESNSDYIDFPVNLGKGFEGRWLRKQKMQEEPRSLNVRWTSDHSNIKANWDAIPSVKQSYWKQRDTLTILELAFILEGKEPQPAYQNNVLSLYPVEFCEFFAELLSLADSSYNAGLLQPIDQPLDADEENYTADFNTENLINWALSKGLDIPNWLINKSPLNKNSTSNVQNNQNINLGQNKASITRRTRRDNLAKAIMAAIEDFGNKPSFEDLWQYFQDNRDSTGFVVDSNFKYVFWEDTKGERQTTPKKSLANRLARIKT